MVVALTRNFESDWVLEWTPYIVGGVGLTVFVSIASIVLLLISYPIFRALDRLKNKE